MTASVLEKRRSAVRRSCHKAYWKDPEKGRAKNKEFYQKRRQKVLDHYGRSCVCCGETKELFLCIDHINGGGNQHARQVGPELARWLIREGFPKGFQTLCHNCNHAKRILGECDCGA